MAEFGIDKTEGVEAVFVQTHDWVKTSEFFQGLGFELEFDTGHRSGQFTSRSGPKLFVAEVPADQPATVQPVLHVKDAAAFDVGPFGAQPFAPTHFGTAMTTVTDPDGRVWGLQAPEDSLPADGE